MDQLGAENLTPELGGNMQYDHSIWVTNRLVRNSSCRVDAPGTGVGTLAELELSCNKTMQRRA